MQTHRIHETAPYNWQGLFTTDGTFEAQPETLEEQIREEYSRRLPAILQLKGRGGVKMRFADFDYPWPKNAYLVEIELRAAGVVMYHKFPVLNFFISFADPYRKIAVFVEEKDKLWTGGKTPHYLAFATRVLSNMGWQVYALPDSVVNTHEADLLPEHLQDCPRGEYKSDAQYHEYMDARSRLYFLTVDGFARYLRVMRDASRHPASTYFTPEAEADALLEANAVEERTRSAAFRQWAGRNGYDMATYPSGQYVHHRTTMAWQIWCGAYQAIHTPTTLNHDGENHGDFHQVP